MLCAAAAAVCLLAVLSPGPSLSAQDTPERSPCGDSFYRGTPPAGGPSSPPPPRPLCHSLPGGRTFATASSPTCDTAVYSAFHLGPGRTEEGGREEGEPVAEDGDGAGVVVPALLRGGAGPPDPGSTSDPPLQLWDALVSTLLQSDVGPNCSALGGDLYVLTGRGRPWGDGDGCEGTPLWSAACCSVPGGRGDFSAGFIGEGGGGERRVSLRELEEALGAEELFSEGCVGGAVEPAAEAPGEAANAARPEGRTADGEDPDGDGQSAQEDAAASESREQQGAAPSGEGEPEGEEEEDGQSGSLLLYVISTTASILTAPLRPVVSTVTQLPGQVTYVLQEDLGVLAALPGDTFSFFHLLTSDLFSWMGTAADTLLGFGKDCLSNVYHCGSGMLGALLDSCYTGVAGTGTLAGDAVGIFGDGLENCWWVTRFFGGRVWDQSKGYVGTVVSEMGGQTKAVGGGLGRLVWRSGNGVGNIFRMGGGLILGVIDMTVGLAQEAFGPEAES